ncbi:HAMP domain-containing sensor histidine kinase [Flavilitoribacter nigricans]|uniref:histidine kinase n=1 Tax=Flavilitoribacter nigricans (strain ATCC 23147 / DSM 23189 / NBRC 102662 / NCIMB 1420 / SS-2) TaxID=1122177 RepID=A0A2D0N250_FLAN2|nr:ATP-binding protein [Flavilitoribacter nigricans]PHN02466.1 two-component sensor histidine kinase [Flavilitoribacter nigricans DSM 23189 = NBRC 102662]
MKIRDKITLIFTLLTGSLLLFIFIFIYFFSYRYAENESYLRLRDRTRIAAQAYLERDELSAVAYDRLLTQHQQIIPGEKELILPVDTTQRELLYDASALNYPDEFFNRIFEQHYGQIKIGSVYHTGILYPDNSGNYIVIVSARDQAGSAEMRRLLNILILSFLLGLVLTYFVGTFYSDRVLRPISAITDRANEISATNLHLRLLTSNTKDELNELATTFNHMLDRLETSFETQNNFINNASHELRNPLTAILGETEIALNKDRSGGEYRQSLETVQNEAQRLDLLVKSLLKLAQTGLEDKRLIIAPLRIDELLIQVKQQLDTVQPGNQVKIDFSGLPEESDYLLVQGNESLLTVALNNILDNACKFSENQEVIVRIRAGKKSASIEVSDRGVGIPEEDIRKITEPFYRADNARAFRGFGVGLPLASKIIKIHGGTTNITSRVGQGTQVTVEFPNYRLHNRRKIDVSII